jgi:hypothetical protein
MLNNGATDSSLTAIQPVIVVPTVLVHGAINGAFNIVQHLIEKGMSADFNILQQAKLCHHCIHQLSAAKGIMKSKQCVKCHGVYHPGKCYRTHKCHVEVEPVSKMIAHTTTDHGCRRSSSYQYAVTGTTSPEEHPTVDTITSGASGNTDHTVITRVTGTVNTVLRGSSSSKGMSAKQMVNSSTSSSSTTSSNTASTSINTSTDANSATQAGQKHRITQQEHDAIGNSGYQGDMVDWQVAKKRKCVLNAQVITADMSTSERRKKRKKNSNNSSSSSSSMIVQTELTKPNQQLTKKHTQAVQGDHASDGEYSEHDKDCSDSDDLDNTGMDMDDDDNSSCDNSSDGDYIDETRSDDDGNYEESSDITSNKRKRSLPKLSLSDITPKLVELLKAPVAECCVCGIELRPLHNSIPPNYRNCFLSCTIPHIISMLENYSSQPASKLTQKRNTILHKIVIKRDKEHREVVSNIDWGHTSRENLTAVHDTIICDSYTTVSDDDSLLICSECVRLPSDDFAFVNNIAANAEHKLIETPHIHNASMRRYGDALLHTQQHHQLAVTGVLTKAAQADTAETVFEYKMQHQNWHSSASGTVVSDADMTAVPTIFKKIAHDGSLVISTT